MAFYKQAGDILEKLEKGTGTIKSLVLADKVVDKKRTYALIVETLKYKEAIASIIKSSDLLKHEKKIRPSVATVLVYDLLFGRGIGAGGTFKPCIMRHKARLQAELAKLKIKRRVKDNVDLIPDRIRNAIVLPRYIRVNTLKTSVDVVVKHFEGKGFTFLQGPDDGSSTPRGKTLWRDKHIPEILVLPPNIDLHDDLLLQNDIEAIHTNFLDVNPSDPKYRKVQCILLDPSCSGSGIVGRMDHLVADEQESETSELNETARARILSLAAFQRSAIVHAFKFPSVRKVVYSTCSKHREENEDVVKAILEEQDLFGLVGRESVLPEWERRGVGEDQWGLMRTTELTPHSANSVVRTDPEHDAVIGFFVALFEKKRS
ncbi:putative 28S rRNA (cytosine-C(5))-methyltransferase [Borealophlyctis nickersoniae]|nr:putative 28S rRNA (cytosine-C(5))-methyltransferase [Borealophlyctis nickersoniae]